MSITLYVVSDEGKKEVVVPEGTTVLAAIRDGGEHLDAPCGGAGKCMKCQVLASRKGVVGYELACQNVVEDGMEVVLESPKSMVVSVEGAFDGWVRDASDLEEGLGIAVDIGTTTVAMRLLDLQTGTVLATTGRANPQITYGADVVSRISACVEGKLDAQRALISNALADMVRAVLKEAKATPDQVKRFLIAGNTTMESLAAGVDPVPIGTAPYEALSLFGGPEALDDPYFDQLPAPIMAPCLAGYVGGDITCGMMAIDLMDKEKPLLLLDLGTNGEMALGCKTGAVSCATAAGPVFEGANIRCGMPAYPGAISKVAIDGEGLSFSTIGDAEPVGICGTGLIDTVACLVRLGVVDDTGRFADEDELPESLAACIDEDDDGVFFRIHGNVVVSQRDVRNLQLAKSAVISGILVMMDDLGISYDDIDELLIAGGFGEYLNLANAAAIGLFPSELLDVARSVGNSSLEGATQAVLSAAAHEALDRVAKDCRYIELSTTPSFNEYYVENMYFEEGE